MARETKHWLTTHLVETELRHLARVYSSGLMIDIGCGTKPYEALFAPYVRKHVGVEHTETRHGSSKVDVWGTAYQIPLADASFDTALCTCVLEHLEDPQLALCECHRVLKPRGVAIYVAPFIWHIHEEPRDFFRFSRYGLSYLFTQARFELIDIKALSGFWGTFGQFLVYNLYRLNRGPLRWFHVVDCVGLALQGISYLLDKIDKTECWTSNYIIVARKADVDSPR